MILSKAQDDGLHRTLFRLVAGGKNEDNSKWVEVVCPASLYRGRKRVQCTGIVGFMLWDAFTQPDQYSSRFYARTFLDATTADELVIVPQVELVKPLDPYDSEL